MGVLNKVKETYIKSTHLLLKCAHLPKLGGLLLTEKIKIKKEKGKQMENRKTEVLKFTHVEQCKKEKKKKERKIVGKKKK